MTEGQGSQPGFGDQTPAGAEAWCARGLAHLERSEPCLAAEAFGRCLALDPAHAEALWHLALLQATLERRLAAIELFERLLVVAPGRQEAHVRLAHMDAALGWIDRAHGRFAALGKSLPGWWEQTRRERLHAVRRQRDLLEALDARPGRLSWADEIARAEGRLALGHLPAAVAAIRRLEQMRPGSAECARLQAGLLLRRDGLDAALAFVERLPGSLRNGALALPWARLLHEAGDAAGVARVLAPHLSAGASADALHLLTLSAFAAGDTEGFLEASRRWLALCNDETRPCMFAIAAGRTQGLVERWTPAAGVAAGTPARLPLILQFWHARAVPDDVSACMATWSARHPGAEHRLLSASSARDYLAATCEPGVLACFDDAHHPAMQSDIIRLAVLAREGGVYVDADERCVASIAPLVRALERVDLVGWLSPETPAYVFNGFIAARPGCRIVIDALRELVALRERHRAQGIRSDIWQVSGPGLITRAIGRAMPAAGGRGRIMLLTDAEWRAFAHTDDTLAYKHAGAGNWRLG